MEDSKVRKAFEISNGRSVGVVIPDELVDLIRDYITGLLEDNISKLTAGIAHRLADLIEPSDSGQTVAEDMFGQMRHSTKQERIAYADMMARNSVELHPVDRDALLALAEEMVEMFRIGAFTGEGIDAKWCRELHDKCTCRIREALGVDDG